MCGRYTLIRLADFTDMFPWIGGPGIPPPPRYNIAPSQPVAVVPNDGQNRIEFFNWGLIPPWAKDPAIGNRMINARAETLADKPAFRDALKRRRCLIPASGFYEWRKDPAAKTRTPMYIRRKDASPFAFAGLWEVWHGSDGSKILSCTIITGQPNELVAAIHNRMPVILDPGCFRQWLDPNELAPDELLPLFKPCPSDQMRANAVSRAVNNPANDTPVCIEPAAAEAAARARPHGSRGSPGELFG